MDLARMSAFEAYEIAFYVSKNEEVKESLVDS